jgi:predicted ATPase
MLSAHFVSHACFKSEWSGFDAFKLMTVIVGRNNSGKSNIIDLVKVLCNSYITSEQCSLRLTKRLEEDDLRKIFPENVGDYSLSGDPWRAHGKRLTGGMLSWVLMRGEAVASDVSITLSDGSAVTQPKLKEVYTSKLFSRGLQLRPTCPLSDQLFRHLAADRDISAEREVLNNDFQPDGRGATNLIQRCINSVTLPRDLVRKDILIALNEIFSGDGKFLSLTTLQRDDAGREWEIYLEEEHKGFVPLSKSGSGLKTVILVLLNLIVIPKIADPTKKCVFAFEELENSLHPALLRRLVAFIERYALKNRTPVFLTTHSPVLIDLFGTSDHAQIVQVTHDGTSAATRTVTAHFDKRDILAHLGARPSDILQANGIIWVEGPSDRVYVNRWIQIVSNGELVEGRHYQCAFFGGALLARYQVADPTQQLDELANLLTINPNLCVVCDSDRKADGADLKRNVVRMLEEVGRVSGGFMWVTATKEIENYLPGEVLARVFDNVDLVDPEQFESFFPAKDQESYHIKKLGRQTAVNKVWLAEESAAYLNAENMVGRFDWLCQTQLLVEKIRGWNS